MNLGTRLAQAFIRVVQRVVPTRPSALVVGYRDTEENATVLAAALARSEVPVVYLCDDPRAARRALELAARLFPADATGSVRLARQRSIRGVWLFLRSEVVFHTHGVYGSPSPRGRRMQVLLGHGHGPKSASPSARPIGYQPTLATTNNALWGSAVLREQGVRSSAVKVTGNPRDDRLVRPDAAAVRRAVGLAESSVVVAWLPTYRRATRHNSLLWQDTAVSLELDQAFLRQIASLGAAAAARDITLLVSTHDLDDARFDVPGFVRVNHHQLASAGVTFYELLAATDAVISDYSSVWVDYLIVDRPVALWCPDVSDYAAGRGFNEPGLIAVAGELLIGAEDFDHFLDAVLQGADWRRSHRRRVRDALGLVVQEHRTSAILAATAHEAAALGLQSAAALGTAASDAAQPIGQDRSDPTQAA